jgi:ferrochelatase
MPYRAEPPHEHGREPRVALLLVALGTPDEPSAPALRRYLAEFLSDPRVVEIPRAAWWPILHGVILRTRPAKSAAKYRSVWLPEGSPLAVWTARQAAGVSAELAARGHRVLVRYAMRYGNPALPDTLDALRAEGATRILVLPMYPQYAAATTGSVVDKVGQWASGARRVPELRFVGEHHDDAGYVVALAESLQDHWAEHGRAERLLLSFHGLPARSLALGDPYFCHCHKTARRLAEHLGLDPKTVQVSFQSRFGKARWLEPYTEPTLREWGAAGVKSVDVICPGFVADCLETLEEVAMECRDAFVEAGGREYRYVPCLNARTRWIDALADLAERHLQGWPTRREPDARALAEQRERALALGAAK